MKNGARHNSVTKLCYAFLKYENELKNRLRKLTHRFEVHSNESASRKSGCLGLEQVLKGIYDASIPQEEEI